MTIRRLALALVLLVAGCTAAGEVGPVGPMEPPHGPFAEQLHRVPLTQADGSTRTIVMRVCRPPGAQSGALVVINHGSPGLAAARQRMRPARCESEPVRWFMARGMVVALPLRRGYGTDGGDWPETYGSCERPDFVLAGRETARDIDAAIAYATRLPGVSAEAGVVVVGQSAGGWGAIALASESPREVRAFVNFAGGRAGRQGGVPNANCRPDLLVAAAGALGARARGAPMLWVYTENDSFFAPVRAAEMHAAWTAAGGRAELRQLPAFGTDGHGLFAGRGGSRVWGPVVERYLQARLAAAPRPGATGPAR